MHEEKGMMRSTVTAGKGTNGGNAFNTCEAEYVRIVCAVDVLIPAESAGKIRHLGRL